METRIDPTDPDFDRKALSGTELLRCTTCGATFRLDYADAMINKDVDAPKKDCCAKMMDVYVEKTLRHDGVRMWINFEKADAPITEMFIKPPCRCVGSTF